MMSNALTLAIDTSSTRGGVGLSLGGAHLYTMELGPAGSQAETILVAIDALLTSAGRVAAELGLVVVSLGPGSFAGLRIGLAAAKGIGFGRGIPVVGVPTTTIRMAWARRVSESRGSGWVAVLDARRGEVFVATGKSTPADPLDIDVISGPDLVPAADVSAILAPWFAEATPSLPLVFCGEGIPVIAAELMEMEAGVAGGAGMANFRTISPPRPPDAVQLLAAIGRRQYQENGAPPLLEPLYVRSPDARKPARFLSPLPTPGSGPS